MKERLVFSEHYKIGNKLGSGAYAEVFEATDVDTNKAYAVKITKLKKEKDASVIRRELDVLKSLDHPNIVKLIENFVANEVSGAQTFYSVLELLKGGELFDRIVEKSFYNEREARDLVCTILKAVKYMHDKNVVHRFVSLSFFYVDS